MIQHFREKRLMTIQVKTLKKQKRKCIESDFLTRTSYSIIFNKNICIPIISYHLEW